MFRNPDGSTMQQTLSIPESAMRYFRLTGSIGGKQRAKLYSQAQLREWGKLGGRPRKDGTRPGQRRKKGGR
jgi:hypothetical protein